MPPRFPPSLFLPSLLAAVSGVLVLLGPGAAAHGADAGGPAAAFALPGWVLWTAGALVVAVSFAMLGLYATRPEAHRRGPVRARREPAEAGAWTPGWSYARGVAVVVLLLALVPAVWPGSSSAWPAVLVWLCWWGLFPFLAYTVIDPWPRLTPFAPLLPLAAWLRGGRAPLAYPARLAAWPSVVVVLLVTHLEVAGGAWSSVPARLALVLAGYAVWTFAGMVVFGPAWLEHAEGIGRSLRWWRAVGPVGWHGGRPHWRGAVGPLVALRMQGWPDVAFTVAILYGVNHDALVGSGAGAWLLAHLAWLHVPAPALAMLVVGFLVFLMVFARAMRRTRDAARVVGRVGRTAAALAASLLPIAAGYHVAHNLFYLLGRAPEVVVAVVDPIGLRGSLAAEGAPWTAALAATVPAALLQVALVLAGHVAAVVAAHHLTAHAFAGRVQALRAEIPLTFVMVVYTWTGLALFSAGGSG